MTPTPVHSSWGLAIRALMLILALLVWPLSASATPFGAVPSLVLNGNYDYIATGNTLRAARNSVDPCSLVSGATGTNVSAGSSSSNVTLPVGTTPVMAYLFWAGSSNTADYNVTFNGTPVSAGTQFSETDGTNKFFGGMADVTTLVNTNGSNTFTGMNVNNSSTYCNNESVLAAWSLVVFYEDPNITNIRTLNLFTGFQRFQYGDVTLTPNNFKTPPTQAEQGGKMTIIVWEGDESLGNGEDLRFNNVQLSNALNPLDNIYNSTISKFGVGSNTTWGVDVDTYDVTNDLAPNDESATTYYKAGQDANILTAQIVQVNNVPVIDLELAKTAAVASVLRGSSTSFTLKTRNKGPSAASGITTITDVLPTGLTFVSGTGTGWSCTPSGQTVTCTRNDVVAIPKNTNLPDVTLNVTVDRKAPANLTNTASVANSSMYENILGNNSSSAAITTYGPDLSTSTKTVSDLNGGEVMPGDVLRYTITLKETAGYAATAVHVTDNMPENVGGLNVTNAGGGTNSSTPTGGVNNTGLLDISNITVPANGTVTLVYEVTVNTGTAPGIEITNLASIDYANPNVQTVTTTVIVAPSLVNPPSSGSKVLYLLNGGTLTRTPTTAQGTDVTINKNSDYNDWILTPALAAPLTLAAGADIDVRVIMARSGGNNTRNWSATLFEYNGNTLVSPSIASGTGTSFNSGTFAIRDATISVTGNRTIPAGHTLRLRITNTTTGGGTRDLLVRQYSGDNANGRSRISFDTATVINVDSLEAYSAAYPNGSILNSYRPGDHVFLRAVVSDPFGEYDINPAGGLKPVISLKDNNNNNVTLTQANLVEKTENPANGATRTYEYDYTLPILAADGTWTASLVATEGVYLTDRLYNGNNDIKHTRNSFFTVASPNITLMKAVEVLSDPTGNAKPHAIPGAILQYSVTVQNNGMGYADGGSLNLSDVLDTNTDYLIGSTSFTDGSPTSGLNFTLPGNLKYCTSAGDNTCSLTSGVSAGNPDPDIRKLRFLPQGALAGKANPGAAAPSFVLKYQVQLK